MKPKKVILEKFADSKDNQICTEKISAAFLLMSMAKTLMEDTEELLNKYNLSIGTIKKNLLLTEKYYKQFNCDLRIAVEKSPPENLAHFFEDYEELEKIIYKFLDLKSSN